MVIGLGLGALTKSIGHLLPSNIVQRMVGLSRVNKRTPYNSWSSLLIGITSLRDWGRAIYLDLIVDRTILGYRFENYMIAQLVDRMTSSVHDIVDDGLLIHIIFRFPAKKAPA